MKPCHGPFAILAEDPATMDPVTEAVPDPGADQAAPAPAIAASTVVTVVVTRERPALLRRCLETVAGQAGVSNGLLVVDNASADDTPAVVAAVPTARYLRLDRNAGGAGGFHAGIAAALATNPDFLWLMDDDGHPQAPDCLSRLLATARTTGADIVGPLAVDLEAPDRLSFPIRLDGRTRFLVRDVEDRALIHGFAHLFNGVLVRASVFDRIGLPDARLFIRGDEVEFLLRARRRGLHVLIDTAARFRHPSTKGEIFPILGGLFYAVMPGTPMKRYYQFRNRGHIFRRYGMWGFLAADIVRYGCFFLVNRRGDMSGFRQWAAATWLGFRGDLRPWTP